MNWQSWKRAAAGLVVLGWCACAGAAAPEHNDQVHRTHKAGAAQAHKLDHSGQTRRGKASFYARKFAGRKMASGNRMDPGKHVAASKRLPLGTVAKVTNLETGQSTAVTIEDRGPYVRGRIIDLSPSAAREIGITHHNGVAPVEVAPIAVPTPDGGVKPGDGASASARDAEVKPRETEKTAR